jgi:predicted kinase
MTGRAAKTLRRGRSALLDATFSSERYRRAALAEAEACGAASALIEVHADETTTLERVGRERPESEAKVEVYRLLRRRFDPIDAPHLSLDSSSATVEQLAERALDYLERSGPVAD